jgi:hypothetical protein
VRGRWPRFAGVVVARENGPRVRGTRPDSARRLERLLAGAAFALALVCLAFSASAHHEEPFVACAGSEPIGLATGAQTDGCRIGTASDVDLFSLPAASGEAIRVRVASESLGLDPELEVRDAAGALLGAFGCDGGLAGGDASACAASVDLLPPTEDGALAISVRDAGADETGDYVLLIETLPPGGFLEILSLQALSEPYVEVETVSLSVDVDAFAVVGEAGEHVRVELTSGTNHFDPRLEVWEPDGALRYDVSCDGGAAPELGQQCALAREWALAQEGMHVLSVSDLGSDEEGVYLIRVIALPEPDSSLLRAAAAVLLIGLRRRLGAGSPTEPISSRRLRSAARP